MKGNKKVLVAALLLLLVAVSFGTYAIYKSSATGNTEVKAAAWVITVNNDDIVANDTFTLGDITWTVNNGTNNTIAPGDRGTLTIAIDASATEVASTYNVEIGSVAGTPLTVAVASGSSLTGSIAAGGTATVTLDVVWATADENANNIADTGYQGNNLNIPVTVTVSQSNYS